MRRALEGLAIVAAIAGLGYALAIGWSKNEVVECEKWLAESSQFAGWYSTDWQREQCKAYGYTLPEGYNKP